ncbi:hypothetical protein MMC25_008052 [Agyrium rufum]|nr:hypothetical protein [Agyrium rufum]
MDALLIQHKSFYESEVRKFSATHPEPSIKADSYKKADSSAVIPETAICVRLRPLLPSEIEAGHVPVAYVRPIDGTGNVGSKVDLHDMRVKVTTGKPVLETKIFSATCTYGVGASTESIYEDVVAPLIPWVWDGGIATLFAYGQTGSGKTFTVTKLQLLAAEDLLGPNRLAERREISLCAFELMGNASFDLLNARKPISILEDSFGVTQLVGAVETKCTTKAKLISSIEEAMALRSTASTAKNDQSSRSHAICRIRIVNNDVTETPDGFMYLVDLAGSEGAGDSKAHSSQRMKETRDVNVSLSVLKDCIRGRAMWSAAQITGNLRHIHVPYKTSRLTQVLKSVFDVKADRSCKTAVIACVGPRLSDAAHSKNTLRFAEMLNVPMPVGKKRPYKPETPASWTNAQLRQWIPSNTGSPPVDPDHLARDNSGLQVSQLTPGEFLTRCCETEGVTAEQAKAVYDKIWRMNIDSQTSSRETQAQAQLQAVEDNALSSAKLPATPFTSRLRPGMFIEVKNEYWRQNPRFTLEPEKVILLGLDIYNDQGLEDRKKSITAFEEGEDRRYICARVEPGLYAGAYNVFIAKQRSVPYSDMIRELLFEFDEAGRYYYLSV